MRQVRIKSKYNPNEQFEFDESPKLFSSVTNKTIQRMRKYCIWESEQTNGGKYPVNALDDMMRSVVGRFDLLYSRLEGDYSSRRSKLDEAYSRGLGDIDKMIIEFKKTIVDHDMAFKQYKKAYFECTGEELDTDLSFDKKTLSDIEARFEKLDKEINNGK